ncbi:MAG TPA: hypothetical protein V6D05_12975 [Stenomitos sp.]
MAQCKECTYEIPAGSPVCTTCGAPAPTSAAGAPVAKTEKASKGVDEWLLRGVLGFLAAIVVAAAGFTLWSLVSQVARGG